MRRQVVLGLALISTLTGCVSAPPKGALVEYHAGLTPITRPVKCEATYALYVKDQVRGSEPLLAQSARKGERIGFRREEDGSVTAIAPGCSLVLAPGAYAWEVVPGTVAPWRKRAQLEVGETVLAVLGVTGFAALLVGLAILAGPDESSDTSQNPTTFNVDYYPNRNTHGN